MPKKKPAKKPTRGAGVSVTLPTEPLAGDAKTTPVMAVMVQDDGTPILEYEIKEGQSIQFRVGGTVKAFMERVGPAPDADMFLDADGGNVEAVTIEYEHALSGFQTVSLQPSPDSGSVSTLWYLGVGKCQQRIGSDGWQDEEIGLPLPPSLRLQHPVGISSLCGLPL